VSGIVGNVFARADRRPEQAILEAMADRLVHREPDDAGFVVRGPAGLGIRGLKTVDLDVGRQPMTGEDGSTWVVLAGEIYNHRELSNRLRATGHVFRTRSDTEAVVHAWEVRGRDALEDLEGVFGLAVWHEVSQTLVLARDRLGVKPLYYALLPDQIVFASELKAMLAHPAISREVDVDALSAYLTHGWLPAPQSILRAVRKLPPGHRLVYAGGETKLEPWWDVRYGSGVSEEIVGVAHLAAALDISVRQQLIADVPLGILLSGGMDAATVGVIARGHTPGRLQTFSIGFEEPALDELAHARAMAETLGAEHHEHVVGPRAALDLVDGLAELVDEPLGDASMLPTYLLARFARRFVSVALSGDGADEVFAGSPIYQAHKLARAWQRMPAPLRAALRALVERVPVADDGAPPGVRLGRVVAAAMLDPVECHAMWRRAFSPDEQRELLTAETLARLSAAPSYAALERLAERVPPSPWLEQILYLDLKGFLGEGVLQKIHRVSMASSLEVRVPLVDRRVVEVAALLPPRMKLKGFRAKHILKRTMRGRLPPAVIARPKKSLGVPLTRWLRGELAPLLRDVCEPDALRRGGLFRPPAVQRLLDEHQAGRHDHGQKLYTLLVFLLWSRRYA
jgi:asparagine synthase (glutamine-hydrolysing)